MQLFRAFARASGAVAALLSGTALVQAADVSFLTHWSPETVSKLETAAAAYKESHPDTNITVRAVRRNVLGEGWRGDRDGRRDRRSAAQEFTCSHLFPSP